MWQTGACVMADVGASDWWWCSTGYDCCEYSFGLLQLLMVRAIPTRLQQEALTTTLISMEEDSKVLLLSLLSNYHPSQEDPVMVAVLLAMLQVPSVALILTLPLSITIRREGHHPLRHLLTSSTMTTRGPASETVNP